MLGRFSQEVCTIQPKGGEVMDVSIKLYFMSLEARGASIMDKVSET